MMVIFKSETSRQRKLSGANKTSLYRQYSETKPLNAAGGRSGGSADDGESASAGDATSAGRSSSSGSSPTELSRQHQKQPHQPNKLAYCTNPQVSPHSRLVNKFHHIVASTSISKPDQYTTTITTATSTIDSPRLLLCTTTTTSLIGNDDKPSETSV